MAALFAFTLPLAAQSSQAQKVPTPSQAAESEWRSSEAWRNFLREERGEWSVTWSPATGTPKAIWGSGLPIADWRENNLVEARRHALALLEANRELLKLGTSELREDIGARMHRVWTFKFQQFYSGLEVIGGRADVRVHMLGRVPMFGSTAFQIPAGFDTNPAITAEAAWLAAWQELGEAPSLARQPADTAQPRLVIYGDVHADTLQTPRLAYEVALSNVNADGVGSIGRSYVDAVTGEVLAFVSDKHECGMPGCKLATHLPKREVVRPLMPVPTTVTVMGWTRIGDDAYDPLVNVPMPGLEINVPNIGTRVTDENGQFVIDISSATTISISSLDGRHHQTISGTAAPSGSWTVNPGVATTIQLLSSSASTNQGAHTTTSWWTDRTNEWTRAILGNSSQLDTASGCTVNVNINSSCNAYYTGNSINFYQAGGGCANTAFSTVISHEWGHLLDDRYGGISQTNGLSEGWGDILGCFIVDSPILGSGFQTSGVGIRNANNTTQYPCSGCGVHQAGQSWMGFAWKFRDRLETTYGSRATAISLSNNLVVSTIVADAKNQQDAVFEVFVADDDDGNLSNGTPNYADLAWACDQHSLPYPGQPGLQNDECVDAISLTAGVNGPFTSSGAFTSSPSWPCASGGSDVWFSVDVSGTGTLSVTTCGYASWDTAMQLFSGSCGSLSSIQCNDDSCGGLRSTVSATVSPGTYYVRVGGYSSATGSFSLDVTVPSQPPAAPSALSATAASTDQINLAWTDNSTDETGFSVERATGGGGFAVVATLGANATSYADTGLQPGTAYSYRVAATSAAGTSGYSNTASATTNLPDPPAAPTGLSATAVNDSTISLAWTDNSNDEDEFHVERSNDGTTFSVVAVLGANATSYSDGGLSSGTTFYYRVAAANLGGNSTYSNVDSATTLTPQPPAAPSSLSATAVNDSTINVTWTDNSADEDEFQVERSGDGVSFSLVATLAANTTSYTDTGLSSATTYYYRVAAANVSGTSTFSNVGSATTPTPQPPTAPSGLVATGASSSSIDLSWSDNSSDETGFAIERSPNLLNSWSQIGSVGSNVTSFTDTGLATETSYDYRVRAFNGSLASAPSNVATGTTGSVSSQDIYASSEIAGAGTITGTYTRTLADDGNAQLLEERRSGGRPSSRYSYMVHTYVLTVPASGGLTLFANAWQTPSTDNDNFVIQWSSNNSSWTNAFTISATSDGTTYSAALPSSLAGTVYLRVVDTDQTAGNTAFDTCFVDALWIRTSGISTPTPPTAPTNASATAMSSTQVDVTWVDNSFDEQDFQLQRSTDGVSFSPLATLAPNTQSYSDTSVVGDTTYYYRVRATNTAGLSSWANTGAVTTPGAGTSDATANGETSISSSVSGSYLDTTTLNGVEEGVRELRTGGPPSQRVSYLEHEWTFNVAAGSSVSFHARAWHSNSSDDDFTLSWSSDGVNFQNMMTITATSDPGTYNVFTLPAGTSGTVYVRAEDTDRTPGNGDRDTLFIDHMFIRTQ